MFYDVGSIQPFICSVAGSFVSARLISCLPIASLTTPLHYLNLQCPGATGVSDQELDLTSIEN